MRIHSAALLLLTSLQFTPIASNAFFTKNPSFVPRSLQIRGGETVDATATAAEPAADAEEESLEDRVQAAMKKLGLASPEEIEKAAEGIDSCENGVCEIKPSVPSPDNTESFQDMSARLAKDMDVDETIVQAALGATMQVGTEPEEQRLNEEAARAMIQYEIDAIQKVMEDSEEVSLFVCSSHDTVPYCIGDGVAKRRHDTCEETQFVIFVTDLLIGQTTRFRGARFKAFQKSVGIRRYEH